MPGTVSDVVSRSLRASRVEAKEAERKERKRERQRKSFLGWLQTLGRIAVPRGLARLASIE